jgi:hypothetical protein
LAALALALAALPATACLALAEPVAPVEALKMSAMAEDLQRLQARRS